MNNQKFEVLTWLRGIAAFFVIVNHATISAREPYSVYDSQPFLQPLDVFNLGMFAVYLFFVLSGCTLTLNYAHKVKTYSDFVPFYTKRFFRIWPAFAASLIIFLIYRELFAFFYHGDKSLWIGQFLKDYSFQNILQYLSLTFNITGPRGLFNGPYWSLPIEFQYYLMLPFVLIFMRGKTLNLLMPLLFGAACYIIYSLKLISMDGVELFKMGFSFFGGVMLAKGYVYLPFRLPIAVTAAIFGLVVIVAGLIVNCIVILPEHVPILNDSNNFFGVCSLLVVGMALITRSSQKKNAFNRFFSQYGEISYSTYLFHMIFIGVAVICVVDLDIHSYIAKLLFILAFTLVGSYFLSMLTFTYIEKPSIAWGAKLTNKITNNSHRHS